MSDVTDSTIPTPADAAGAALPAGDDVVSLPEPDEEVLPSGYEVVAHPEAQAADAEAFGETLIAIQGLIQRHSEHFDELNTKMKELRESLKNIYDNDGELQKLEEQAKTVTTDVKTRKQRIKESPESIQFQMKIKEVQEEMNELKDTLNNHLLRYFQMTGSQVIESPDGSEREFSVTARLKGKAHKSE